MQDIQDRSGKNWVLGVTRNTFLNDGWCVTAKTG
jgi:hypothetical protein